MILKTHVYQNFISYIKFVSKRCTKNPVLKIWPDPIWSKSGPGLGPSTVPIFLRKARPGPVKARAYPSLLESPIFGLARLKARLKPEKVWIKFNYFNIYFILADLLLQIILFFYTNKIVKLQ